MAEEVELEEELDRERYLALENDDMRVAEQEGVCVCVCVYEREKGRGYVCVRMHKKEINQMGMMDKNNKTD